MDAHVFRFVKLSAQVEVGQVDGDGLCVGGGQDTVDHDLVGGEIRGARSSVAFVFEDVAANGEANAVRFGFVRTHR